MTTDHSEIRRLPNGAIDTDYYVRQCHRRRSMAAHAVIARLLQAGATLATRILQRRNDETTRQPDMPTSAPTGQEKLRKAA